jgi:hypothetical protein
LPFVFPFRFVGDAAKQLVSLPSWRIDSGKEKPMLNLKSTVHKSDLSYFAVFRNG